MDLREAWSNERIRSCANVARFATMIEGAADRDGFELLFDVSPRPMFVFDRETLALSCVNVAAIALYGWSRAELLTMTIRDLRSADEVPNLEHALARERQHSKTAFSRLSRHATKAGRVLDVDVDMVRITFRGRPSVLCSIVDLTEGETSLRRSEANFRTLIERLPTGTIVHRHGRIIYVNPAGVSGLRYASAADLVGRPILELIHPDDRELIRMRMEQTALEGTAGPAESRMIRRDGTIVVIEAEAVRLDFDGQPANVVIARDVTERRDLFARVATADRLLSMGTLAAGVAHEINNPLAYLVSNLELLARELPADAAALALVADAREAADRVSAIVRDLRELTRPADDASGPVDVVAILASSIKMANNELRHRARVVQSYAADLPRVIASSSRLGQVFLNLLVNAAHAIEEGHTDEAEVRVRVVASADRHTVVVEIEDTGVGIPAAILGRVFDPFFTTKPLGVGIGLGLAISHQIVQSIGGEITVASKVGKGTTFRISLPASPVEIAVLEPVVGPEPERRSLRILMIDDEAMVGRAVAMLLAPDHEVVAVTRAGVALARITAGEAFDVILCDLMMPEMTGMELHDQLAQRAPRYLDRLVFVTGGAFTPQARAFLETPGRRRLAKPFSEEQLRRVIASVPH